LCCVLTQLVDAQVGIVVGGVCRAYEQCSGTSTGRTIVCLNQRCTDVTGIYNDPSLTICNGQPAISYAYPAGTCGSTSVNQYPYTPVQAFVPAQNTVRTYCCYQWMAPNGATTTCPANSFNTGPCTAGQCAAPAVCQGYNPSAGQASGVCCSSSTVATCPVGTSNIGACSSGQCPFGSNCVGFTGAAMSGVCCQSAVIAQCPVGTNNVGACSSGQCPAGSACTGFTGSITSGVCCSSTVAQCPNGATSIGNCVNGALCPTNFQCLNNQCCGTGTTTTCPAATSSIGNCVSGSLCPVGFSCCNGACYPSGLIVG